MLEPRERFVTSGTLRLWTERAGHPDHPALLLIMGSAAQGISCPDSLVARLVARGVQVIRFDHRDTGRSSVVDFDAHPYAIADLAADCLAVLDDYGLPAAHLAGASMGGMIAQWLAVHEPARVRSLTLLTSSPMGYRPGPAWARAQAGEPPAPGDLPPPSPRFLAHLAAGMPPGVESDVALFRVFNGPVRPFDEPAARAMLESALSRATDPAAAGHHHRAGQTFAPDRLAPLSSITAPTTIVHGDQDPVFPLGHGAALAAAIPGARLHVVPGMGHVFYSLPRPTRGGRRPDPAVTRRRAGARIAVCQWVGSTPRATQASWYMRTASVRTWRRSVRCSLNGIRTGTAIPSTVASKSIPSASSPDIRAALAAEIPARPRTMSTLSSAWSSFMCRAICATTSEVKIMTASPPPACRDR